MKVYIILDDSNDLGLGASVEKVFSDKEKAVDYVYAGWMKRSAYVALCSLLCRKIKTRFNARH